MDVDEHERLSNITLRHKLKLRNIKVTTCAGLNVIWLVCKIHEAFDTIEQGSQLYLEDKRFWKICIIREQCNTVYIFNTLIIYTSQVW